MNIDIPADLPKAHTLRLLLPFFFQREALALAVERLLAVQHQARKNWPCWRVPTTVPSFYLEETLPSASDFLFGRLTGGCAYLRVPDETANVWFRNGGLFAPAPGGNRPKESQRPASFAVHLGTPGIELFLSPHGAGVLSISFESAAPNADLGLLQDLNYRLSQVRGFTAFSFQLPADERAPEPPPACTAPLAERLGRRGGAFHLSEWVDFLLAPLSDLGYRRMQEQFSVYSVTRFGAAAEFTKAAVDAELRPFLAAVAHVEEWGHVGSLAVSEQLLNPRHWVALGSLGAAHLVADQDPPRPFDEQRVPVVLHKYFVPYLLSLLQRIALQRLLADARAAFALGDNPDEAAASTSGTGSTERLRGLNLQSLALTVNGCFTEVSSREVLNQYYELVQNGLRVADSFGTLQRALRDAEVMDSDRYQSHALQIQGDALQIVAHVQSKVEWLEVFFVSYYFTALIYYISHGHLFSEAYALWTLILAPVVSGAIAFFALKPHRLHSRHSAARSGSDAAAGRKNADQQHAPHAWGFLIAIVLAFVLWLGVGYGLFRH